MDILSTCTYSSSMPCLLHCKGGPNPAGFEKVVKSGFKSKSEFGFVHHCYTGVTWLAYYSIIFLFKVRLKGNSVSDEIFYIPVPLTWIPSVIKSENTMER